MTVSIVARLVSALKQTLVQFRHKTELMANTFYRHSTYSISFVHHVLVKHRCPTGNKVHFRLPQNACGISKSKVWQTDGQTDGWTDKQMQVPVSDPDWQISVPPRLGCDILSPKTWFQHWNLIIFLVPHWYMHFNEKYANNVLFIGTATLWHCGKRCTLRCDVIINDVNDKREYQTAYTRQPRAVPDRIRVVRRQRRSPGGNHH